MNAVVLVGLAMCLHQLALWGRRNVSRLAPTGLSDQQAASRKRALWRGAWACHGASGLLLVAAVLSVL